MKNYGDLGGFYPPRPTASTDNTPLDHIQYHSHSLIVKYILFKQASLAEKVMLFDKKPLCAFFFQTWMNVPLLPIPVTSIPYARIPWVHTHARVMLGTLEMESPAMVFKTNCRSFMCDHPSKATHKPRWIYTYRNFEITHNTLIFQTHHL